MEPTGQTSVRENWVTFHAISAFGACEKLLYASTTCETEWHSIDWCLSPENNVSVFFYSALHANLKKAIDIFSFSPLCELKQS